MRYKRDDIVKYGTGTNQFCQLQTYRHGVGWVATYCFGGDISLSRDEYGECVLFDRYANDWRLATLEEVVALEKSPRYALKRRYTDADPVLVSGKKRVINLQRRDCNRLQN